jgi:polyhydroxybutyrate depolymerase
MKTYFQFPLLLVSLLFISSCSKETNCNTIRAGDYQCEINFDGQTREYQMYVPSSYTGSDAVSGSVPVVVDIHGFSATASSQRLISSLDEKAESAGFIAIWPQGMNKSFNGAGCCTEHEDYDDVGFIRAIVKHLQENGNINPERIYATGVSNGGAMTHRLACDASDLFSAVAPVSYAMGVGFSCSPERPVSLVTFHAKEDPIVPFSGGVLGEGLPKAFSKVRGMFKEPSDYKPASRGFEESNRIWLENNQCRNAPVRSYEKGSSFCNSYDQCAGNSSVTLCVLHGEDSLFGGHTGYLNDDDVPLSDMIWEFFEQDYANKRDPKSESSPNRKSGA